MVGFWNKVTSEVKDFINKDELSSDDYRKKIEGLKKQKGVKILPGREIDKQETGSCTLTSIKSALKLHTSPNSTLPGKFHLTRLENLREKMKGTLDKRRGSEHLKNFSSDRKARDVSTEDMKEVYNLTDKAVKSAGGESLPYVFQQ